MGRNWFGLAGAWRGRGRGHRKEEDGAFGRDGANLGLGEASLDITEKLSTSALPGGDDMGEDGDDEWELIVKM